MNYEYYDVGPHAGKEKPIFVGIELKFANNICVQ